MVKRITWRNHPLALLMLAGLAVSAALYYQVLRPRSIERPNFLLVITDDQSWIHTSFAGYPAINTPNFDRLANEGVYFNNAYASAPTCTASRSAILTGQHFWRLGSAGQLWGDFPVTLVTYQQLLARHGYKVGYTGKGWGPGRALAGNPAGDDYNALKNSANPNFSTIDHVANLKVFLQEKKPGQPFSFWVSPTEPHRPYQTGVGASSGEIDMARLEVPPFLPNTQKVREDLADYLYEIQWFDRELGEILRALDDAGELDNTVIVYTADNGMPFPRAKSNNYEYGTRVPFTVRWGNGISAHQQVTDFISLTDLAPTFLELAGIPIPPEMTGRSFRLQLLANKSGRIDKQRNTAYSGFERHIGNARLDDKGYPSRAIHSDQHLYIRNIAPERWPAGRPPILADIDDGSPTKNFLMANQAHYASLYALAAGKRPAEELYVLQRDPAQLNNLASNPEYNATRQQLAQQLLDEMQRTGDPWTTGSGAVFDSHTYYGKAEE